MIETIYRFSDTLITNFAKIVDALSLEIVGNFTVLEVILGLGLGAFIGFTIAKWVIDFIP